MEPRFFDSTKHYLSGRFRQYWEANGDLYVFGLPLTRVYDEASTDGKVYKTQYFERAHLLRVPPREPGPLRRRRDADGQRDRRRSGGRGALPERPARGHARPATLASSTPSPKMPARTTSPAPSARSGSATAGCRTSASPSRRSSTRSARPTGRSTRCSTSSAGAGSTTPRTASGAATRCCWACSAGSGCNARNVSEAVQAPETTPPVGADIPGGAPVAGNTTITPLKAGDGEYGFNVFLRADFGRRRLQQPRGRQGA